MASEWLDLLADEPTQVESDGTAILAVRTKLSGFDVMLLTCDFACRAGTLGVREGRALVTVLDQACEAQAVVFVVASGGVRVDEGAAAFIQMARIMVARQKLAEARRPFIAIAADPTLGGMAASLTATADIILALPGARLGFSGPKTSAVFSGVRIDSAESALNAGLVDDVIPPEAIKNTVARYLRVLCG